MPELNNTILKNNTNLKAYYRFESGAETTDSSGNSHTLTLGNTPSGVAGKFGNGLQLVRASNQYAYAADHADFDMGTGVFTIGLLVKRSSTGNYMGLISSVNNSDQNGFQLAFQNTDVLIFNCTDTTGNTATTTSTFTSTSDYYFIVAVRDASFLRIYVNSKHEASTANTSKNTDSTSNLVFGAYRAPTLNANMLDGIIDDAFILKGIALSADQIKELYEGRYVGEGWPQAGLVAGYHLSDTTDFSGNNYHLTNTGTTTFVAGKFVNAASFNGSSQKLQVSNNLGIDGTSITMSGWFKISSLPSEAAQYALFGHGAAASSNTGDRIYYRRDAGVYTLRFRRTKFGVSNTDVASVITLDITKWYHLVYTYDGSNINGYINGANVGTTAITGNGTSGGTAGMTIGETPDTYGFYPGLADEVQVYNVAKDARWVRQQYAWGMGRLI